MIEIFSGDNLPILQTFEDGFVDLIYIDPPFNTGKTQKLGNMSFDDCHENFMQFMEERLREAYRI